MNGNAIYELRERLEAAAVAGTALAAEDFRLQRACEQMEPLAAASPVFRRITDMARQAASPDCPDRPGVLLDVLGLLDAVIVTQGNVSKPEEMAEAERCQPAANGARILTEVPYSKLEPVLELLRGQSGSQAPAQIRKLCAQQPELLSDYRVRGYLKSYLDRKSAPGRLELEDLLRREGPALIPWLKEDFSFDEDSHMEWRLRMIGLLAGQQEQAFFQEVISKAAKDAKTMAIAMLRYGPDNTEVLLDLIRSERGSAKKAALWALSFMDTPEAEAFWQEWAKKKPAQARELLADSKCVYASDMVAEMVSACMRAKTAGYPDLTQEQKEKQGAVEQELIEAMIGKTSSALLACYPGLVRIWPEGTARLLMVSLIETRHPALLELAEKLYREMGDTCLAPALLAAIFTETPEAVYERFAPCLQAKGKGLFGLLGGPTQASEEVWRVFGRLAADSRESGELCFRIRWELPLDLGMDAEVRVPVMIDNRWYALLIQNAPVQMKRPKVRQDNLNRIDSRYWPNDWNHWDQTIAELYRPGNRERDIQYGRYFYGRAQERGTKIGDVQALRACGWEQFHGLIEWTKLGDNYLLYEQLGRILDEIPLSNPEKGGELSRLIARQGSQKGTEYGVRQLERWRDNLLQGFPRNSR